MPRVGLGFSSAAIAMVIGCARNEPPVPTPPAPHATVLRFEASSASVPAGETVALTWQTIHAVRVTIAVEGGPIVLETTDALGVVQSPALTEDTRFTLSAQSAAGEVTRAAVAVELLAAPSETAILQFSAHPLSIAPGDSARLSWEVANAASLDIAELGRPTIFSTSDRLIGELAVRPAATTTYVLSAGARTRSVTITVEEVPPEPPDPSDACADASRGPRVSWFTEVASALPREIIPPSAGFFGSGGALVDLDGDELLDLILTSRAAPVAVFRNIGGLSFEEHPARAGIDSRSPAAGVALGDLDGDGDPDLLLLGSEQTLLYENIGGANFRRVPAPQLEAQLPAESALLADFDGDGRLEILLNIFGRDLDSNEDIGRGDRLFRDRGNFDYLDITEQSGLIEIGRSWVSSLFDVNGDGVLDVYIANDTFSHDYGGGVRTDTMLARDAVFINRGLRFSEASAFLGLDTPKSSMGGLVGDFDADGIFDLYIPNFGKNPLYLGRPGAPFLELAEELGVAGARRNNPRCATVELDPDCLLISWSAVLEDFDHDGVAELLVANGGFTGAKSQPSQLYVKSGAVYEERDPGLGCFDGRALLPGDLDADGDLDLVVIARNAPVRVFSTHSPPERGWMRVKLRGRGSNREGIGAVVTVELGGGEKLVRPIGAGGAVHSSRALEAHFGLGARDPVALSIRWPSGQVQRIMPVERNRLLTIEEPE